MINLKLKEITTKIRQGLENIYGEQLEQILLFGSQARGHARLDSDIDILIVLKNQFNYNQESDRISFFIAALC